MGFYIAVMLGTVIVGVVSFFFTKDTYEYEVFKHKDNEYDTTRN